MVNINIFIKSDNKFRDVAQHHQLKTKKTVLDYSRIY